MKSASPMNNIHQLQNSDAFFNSLLANNIEQQPQQNHLPVHSRQQSMPASFTQSQQKLSHPPVSQQQVSSPETSSPQYSPQSIHLVSPNKMRPSLPTSPTHIAAMRQAAASSGFEFPPNVNNPYMQQQSTPQLSEGWLAPPHQQPAKITHNARQEGDDSSKNQRG